MNAAGVGIDYAKLIIALLLAAVPAKAAEQIPLPRPRPAPALASIPPVVTTQDVASQSACRIRLTKEFAVAPSLASLDAGGCEVTDAVRLEAIVLPDKSMVAVSPPATLGCTMAEAVVRWVREDVAPAVSELGSPLRSLDNYASFNCRSRNNIAGAPLSEHGRANALDIRSVKLADGRIVKLVDAHAAGDFREGMRKSACARFSTVLGPGSDGYHEDHVHVDLMARANGRFPMCRWEVRHAEPGAQPVAAASPANAYMATPAAPAGIPLPRPRPKPEAVDGTFDARWMPH